MNDDKLFKGTIICYIALLIICLLGLCGYMFIGLKSYYIDVQLKERLLYSGDSCTPEKYRVTKEIGND